MSLFDFAKVCLFSEVNGRVLLNGKPMKNVQILRKTSFQNKKSTEVTSTNEIGEFHFDAKYEKSIAKFLPVEVVISQEIEAIHDSKHYELWKTTKRDYEENSELNGKAMNLVCDLSHKPEYQTIGEHVIKSICSLE